MKYPSLSSISISCSGPGGGRSKSGPIGLRRTREGAYLRFTNADGAFYRHYLYEGSEHPNAGAGHIHLIDPTSLVVQKTF